MKCSLFFPAIRLAAIFMLAVVGFYACQQDFNDTFSSETNDQESMFAVKEAKQYYENVLKKEFLDNLVKSRTTMSKGKNSAIDALSAPPKIYALWKNAYESESPNYAHVELPITYSRRVVTLINITRDSLPEPRDESLLKTVFDRLILSKNRSGNIEQKIISYHPDRTYLEKHGYDASHNQLTNLDEDFSGYLQYKSWEGEPLAIIRVEGGKPVRRYLAKGRERTQPSLKRRNVSTTGSTESSERVMSAKIASVNFDCGDGGEWECEEICEMQYAEICVGDLESDGSDCDEFEVIDEWEECYEDCDYVFQEPCDDWEDEIEFCDDPNNWDEEECMGGGGDDDGDDEDNNGSNSAFEIDYSELRDCLGGVVKNANNLSNNISKLLINVFGESQRFNIKYGEMELPSNVVARSEAEYEYDKESGTVTALSEMIYFNSEYTSKSTDMALVATNFHEGIHSYFRYREVTAITDAEKEQLRKDFSFLNPVELGLPLNQTTSELDHHKEMAKSYVDAFSEAIKEYMPSIDDADFAKLQNIFPELTKGQYYEALAMSGLLKHNEVWEKIMKDEEYVNWGNLDESKKEQIKQLITIETEGFANALGNTPCR